MKPIFSIVLFIVLIGGFDNARASHIVGGQMSYVYQGDTTIGTDLRHIYQVTLELYADCLNGQPESIAQDNPAFLGVFNGGGGFVEIDTNVYFSSSVAVPATFSTVCGSGFSPLLCLLKRTFVKTYYLSPNATGYTVAYERCCRNAATVNITAPGNDGATYYCAIPASPLVNNSAVFRTYPPQIVCLHTGLYYDASATDADGDSLSYGFGPALVGATDADIKPLPYMPVLTDTVVYAVGYNAQAPLGATAGLAIDPITGIMTGTPDHIGRFVVAVYCNEWRAGVLINTVRRDFEFLVDECGAMAYKPYAGNDTTIMVGDSTTLHGAGAASYSWTPGTFLSDASIADPTGYFPAAGDFQYVLHGVSDSGCNATDTVIVHVLAHSTFTAPNAFTPNNDGLNDYLNPIPLLSSTLITFKVYNRMGTMMYIGGPNDNGWDGTYRGKPQAMDTYVWVATYMDNYGTYRQSRGNVTLVR